MRIIKTLPLLLLTTCVQTALASSNPPAVGISSSATDAVAHAKAKNTTSAIALHADNYSTPADEAHAQHVKMHAVNTAALNTANADTTNCNDNAFVTSGRNLLTQIKTQSYDCVGRLFTDASDTVRLGTFTQANIITVANEAKAKALTYNGTDADQYMQALQYWIRAFYYYGNRELLTPENQQATKSALDALFANSHMYDKTAENAKVIELAVVNLNNASLQEKYMPIVHQLLDRYDESYEEVTGWGDIFAAAIWGIPNACARFADCRTAEHTTAFITKLGNFIHNNINWLDKGATDYHLHNLGYQLGNVYSGKNDSHFSSIQATLVSEVNKVFNSYGPLEADSGRRAYLQTLNAVNYRGKCSEHNVCSKKDEIISSVLKDRINCPSGTLFMWAQDMNQAQLDWACSSLRSHEEHFHTTLKTNRIPVTPDDNDLLRMVVFNDASEWRIYGGVLFGASTDNGGLYLEGDPSKAGDQATFFAYEEVPARPIFDIWNLRHEYIHYLDGRFITQGDFRDVNGAGKTVWYGEGIAEYISRRNCNDGAATEAGNATHNISTIFGNEYGVGQNRIYSWGYLASRYMFERQNTTFFNMLDKFKVGDYASYRTSMVDSWISNKTFDADFSNWLTTVTSSGCTVDNTRPPSPIEPIDIGDIQGDELPGINACALNRPRQSRDISAGKAICIENKANNHQVQLGLNVPVGLVDVSLEITLRHGSGNANLLHRWDKRPNSTTYDHISNGPSNNETILVPNVKAGWNYIHVPADSEFTDVTVLARYIQNGAPIDDNILVNGVSKKVSGQKSEEVHFTMQVPANVATLTFDTSGGTGDADMYVKYGAAPTTNSHDCRPYKGGNVEQCVMDNIQAGTYHIMLRGYDNFTDVNLVGKYTTGNNNAAPTALTDGPYSGNVNTAIAMSSNNSSDSDGSIASRAWDFGDGSTSSSTNPSHTYSTAGTYTVTLTVTDNEGATASTTTTATISSASNGNSLDNGVVKLVSGTTNEESIYTLVVPAGASNLTITTSGGSGDVDMHVKFGEAPTKASYDCRPWKVGSNESCTINNVQAGTYYIMLLGHNNYTDVQLVGNYTP
ncbi:collagenase [Pseudoalteromonas sp. MMG012]|uniref:collagenase n=1 Tax=Pseudoalteromonas sp. MMG012 TaxID=2822686 RepID=UPI001B3A3495|nr:collagenase [Pseudoalteromonas sp. MMG012]MBQ4852668.1 collagenase [Pseudoalteromonas sp. MMG012]